MDQTSRFAAARLFRTRDGVLERDPPDDASRRQTPGSQRIRLGRRRGGLARWRGSSGQATTEYLVTAGLLATIAIILNTAVPSGLRMLVRSIGLAVRTIAP